MTSQQTDKKETGESRFKYQLDNVLSTIADDLEKVNRGELTDLKILNLDERIYARLMNLLKTIEEPVAKAKPKKEEEPEPPSRQPNIQDAALKKIRQK